MTNIRITNAEERHNHDPEHLREYRGRVGRMTRGLYDKEERIVIPKYVQKRFLAYGLSKNDLRKLIEMLNE